MKAEVTKEEFGEVPPKVKLEAEVKEEKNAEVPPLAKEITVEVGEGEGEGD